MSTSLNSLILAGLYADSTSTMHSLLMISFKTTSGSWMAPLSATDNYDYEKLAIATPLNNDITGLYENAGAIATCYMV